MTRRNIRLCNLGANRAASNFISTKNPFYNLQKLNFEPLLVGSCPSEISALKSASRGC